MNRYYFRRKKKEQKTPTQYTSNYFFFSYPAHKCRLPLGGGGGFKLVAKCGRFCFVKY